MKDEHHITSNIKAYAVCADILKLPTDGSYKVIVEKLPKSRTLPQNNALYLWCGQVSEELNDKGITVPLMLEETPHVNWDKKGKNFLDLVWRKCQVALTGHESTTGPTRSEYTEIYENINRMLAGWGVHVPWPSRDRL